MSSQLPGPPGRPDPRRPRPTGIPRPVIAGLAVTLLVGALVALGLVAGDGPDGATAGSRTSGGPSAPSWSARAAARLAALPALRYTGTFTSNGRTVQAVLSVTRAGSAVGTLTMGGEQARLVTVDGATYLHGGPSFWAGATGPATRPEDFAGRWSKAPVTLLGFDPQDLLSPSAIARAVRGAPVTGSTGYVGDRLVHRVETRQGVYSVTLAEPHDLLQVEGASNARFAVTAVADAAPVLAELRRRVAALGGARDPGVGFDHGELTFVNCNENVSGCTLQLPVSVRAPLVAGEPAEAARAVLVATISADGRALGSCTGARSVEATGRAVLTCTVTSPGWRAWMRRARDTPGRHEYTAQARVIGEAVSPDRVRELLALVDRETPGS
ncbi:hypothetical protein [Thermomonospora cellulosilytica]|uniref:Uncharacterized protein n=1 Tax=Thermomonospora cellulosilytica TaxID=1411118 RepID=A0A7W3MT34_9ACTN|nr:hypothetical protein [Thermomonospora cellulosilytica]MBA9001377.1 hypothetical protein [Thermomonospora cellulosilytica]